MDYGRTKRPVQRHMTFMGPSWRASAGETGAGVGVTRSEECASCLSQCCPRFGLSARSQHRSSTTPPNGPDRAAAEVSTNSARSGSGSFEANAPEPLTCIFVIASGVCYLPASQFENIWLRTKRHDANGQVKSGSGGVCYLYFPAKPSGTQRRALAELGIR
ncbi:hypothetical protein YWIDRAFT_05697 [Streptomyces sp. SceaMP-e96]|nr:hypothetical protein YWIDRAFT_05697 [Streptomyces sp. SceaMP-e96]